jgi:Holliday junction DNA helicase RuvA
VYEFLEGEVVRRSAARLTLCVGGVGYDLAVPVGSEFERGDVIRVWTQFVVREDAQLLFGFADRETRDLFRLLLSVRGVGPNMALAVLSGLPHDALLEAIVAADLPSLTRIKGVGKKTAEQILLDLRDKALSVQARAEGGAAASVGPAGDPAQANIEDAVQALVSIGFTEKDAQKHVGRAAEQVDANDLESLVRTALAR